MGGVSRRFKGEIMEPNIRGSLDSLKGVPNDSPVVPKALSPEVSHARQLIDAAYKQGIEVAIPALVALNEVHPGIITKALTHDSLLARNFGNRFGTFLPWVAAIEPSQCLATTSYHCREMGSSWQDSLSADQQLAFTRVTDEFTAKVPKETVFDNRSKVHLGAARVEDGGLWFDTHTAFYADNAAVCHVMGEALYKLSKVGLGARDISVDAKNVRAVLELLGKLGVKVGESGIDFSLGRSIFPHTLGVSGVLLTADGFLLQAQQGKRNMASGGDFVPAISGSADPLPGTDSVFDPYADFGREQREEQGDGPLSFWAVTGVYQSLHRLGKPEVIVMGVLKDSLLEFMQKQHAAGETATSWELKKKISSTTLLAGFKPDLEDRLQSSDRVVEIEARSGESVASGAMRRGNVKFHIEPAGSDELLARIRSGGIQNHVNQLALASALEYLKLSQDP